MSNNSPSFGPTKLSDNSGDSLLQRRNGIATASDDGGVSYLEVISRESIMRRAQGIISESFPRTAFGNQSTNTTATVYYVGIPLLTGDVISSLVVAVGIVGSGLTLAKVGLYTPAGVLVASSADISGQLTSLGQKVGTFTTPYTVTASGLYYAAVVQVGTTPAALVRGSTASAATGWITPPGAGQLLYGTQAGADLPANAVITGGGTTSLGTWMAAI